MEDPSLLSEKDLKCIDFTIECQTGGVAQNQSVKMRNTLEYMFYKAKESIPHLPNKLSEEIKTFLKQAKGESYVE